MNSEKMQITEKQIELLRNIGTTWKCMSEGCADSAIALKNEGMRDGANMDHGKSLAYRDCSEDITGILISIFGENVKAQTRRADAQIDQTASSASSAASC